MLRSGLFGGRGRVARHLDNAVENHSISVIDDSRKFKIFALSAREVLPELAIGNKEIRDVRLDLKLR